MEEQKPKPDTQPTGAQTAEPQVEPNPMQISEQEKPKSRKKLILLGLILLILLGVGAAYAFFMRKPSQTPKVSTTSNAKPAPAQKAKAPTYASSLVFQTNPDKTHTTFSVNALDGSLQHSLTVTNDTTPFQPTFADSGIIQFEGDSVVLANNDSSAFARLGNDGTAQNIPAALSTLLGGSAHVGANLLAHVISVNGQMFGIEAPYSTGSYQLVALDLSKGTTSSLLTATILDGKPSLYGPIQLLNVSEDGGTVYLLAVGAQLNGTTVPGKALLAVDVKSKKYTVKAVPDTTDVSSVAASKDGKYVVYTTVESDGKGYSTSVTHIFNTQSNKEVKVSTEGLEPDGNSHEVSFAPDGAYFSVVGHYAADTKQAGYGLQIISTSTNKVVHQVDLPGVQNMITSIGWSADDSMMYTNNTSSTGIYTASTEKAHSYNPAKDKTFDYPSSLGSLISVLNYPK